MANKSSSSGTSPSVAYVMKQKLPTNQLIIGKTEVEAIVDSFINNAKEFTTHGKVICAIIMYTRNI